MNIGDLEQELGLGKYTYVCATFRGWIDEINFSTYLTTLMQSVCIISSDQSFFCDICWYYVQDSP